MGSSKRAVLPFAPDIGGWTDDHYEIYSLVEYALGNRKELSKEEMKEVQAGNLAEELLESGDPDWLKKALEFIDDGGDLDAFEIDEATFLDIDRSQRLRGE